MTTYGGNNMKKIRPILGISLLVQSVTFFVLCLLNLEKKKSLAKCFGIFGALGGIAGTWLLVSEYKSRKALQEDEDYFEEFDEYDEFDEFDDEITEDEINCAFEGGEA